MKKFLSIIMAVVFVVFSATTAQAATNLEGMLKELNVPAAEAKVITDYVVANNISNETVEALVGEAQSVIALIENSSLFDLDADTQALIQTKVVNAAASVGLNVSIDGAKVTLNKSNGDVLISLSTDVLEEVVSTTNAELAKNPKLFEGISEQYKEERTLYHNNRPGNGSNSSTENTTTNTPTATTPATLNKTGFNAMPLVAGLAVMTLGVSLFVVSRKINA